ncbi:MAG: hypothetical protein ACSLFN_12295 [Candidatus Limnocylindrales bacterium]
MTVSFAVDARLPRYDLQLEYAPGACNIGPAEIARRRRSGHAGLLATLALFAVLIAVDAPPLARLLIALPAAGAASGYLQARFRFCAAFGFRGIFNFDALGSARSITDRAAAMKDRRRAAQIAIGALATGAAVGVAAALLPL